MPNRYTRDEVIRIALEQAQIPNIIHHDMPDGVVLEDAWCVQWLQDGIDHWHHMVPFSAVVKNTSLTITSLTTDIALPTNFIVDVRNGLIVQNVNGDTNSRTRKRRLPLQRWISKDLAYQGQTNTTIYYYAILYDDVNELYTLKVTPQSSETKVASIWYYSLPARLESDTKPRLPSDYLAIEYVKLRCLEWVGKYEAGTAQGFCDKEIGKMRAAGLLNETEDDEIPFDEETFINRQSDVTGYSWLGNR